MSIELNTTKGRELVMQIRNAGDSAWEILGGVISRGITFNNPTEDTTSTSVNGDYSEGEFTGFSQVTLNVSGNPDKRVGVEPITGLTRVKLSRLVELATSGNRNGKFRFVSTDPDLLLDVQGFFNITNFELNGDETAKAAFSATFESKDTITVTTT